jgi:hypothetical protein
MKLLARVLSPMGLEKVNEIREADDDYKVHGSQYRPGSGGGSPGGPPAGQNGTHGGPPARVPRPPVPQGGQCAFSRDDLFGSNLYYISFLGKPSTVTPWMLQFGGHHLALNITIAGSKGVLATTLTGASRRLSP